MSNVIPITVFEEENLLKEHKQKLEQELEKLRQDIAEVKKQILDLDIEKSIKNRGEQGNIKTKIAEARRALKIKQDNEALLETQINNITKDIVAVKKAHQTVEHAMASEENIRQALQILNANYVASESQWYCVYHNGVRSQPLVRVVSTETIKDLIMHETGWFEPSEINVKKVAIECGRSFRDVERTFDAPKKGVLNQMNELRTFWLKPIHGEPSHVAFDILISNLADGDAEYRDFIERWVAYIYVNPEDIYVPSIDSSAKGGSGRDTFFRILEIIFTEECCGEATKETFSGTHNGELWGKVLVKINEQNSTKIDYDQFKNLTGSHNFRLRRMGENAVQAPRTFKFFIASNRHSATIHLTGGGIASEDRRVAPLISLTSLTTAIGRHFNLDETKISDREKIYEMLQGWHEHVFQNPQEIARWLGAIIDRHQPHKIKKLLPLHGKYYTQMLERQKNAFNRFMEIVQTLSLNSNCYDINFMHSVYQISSCVKIDKTQFGKRMCQWWIERTGQEWEIKLKDIYVDGDFTSRTKRTVIYNKQALRPAHRPDGSVEETAPLMFDAFDFIEFGKLDEKGNSLNNKPHANNINSDLL